MGNQLTQRDDGRLYDAYEAHLAGRYDEAQPIYKRLARKYPGNEQVQSLLAVLLLDTGKPAKALPTLRALARTKPGDADRHYNLGLAHVALGHHEDAVAAYRRAIECEPQHARAHYNLGVAYKALGAEGKALASLLRDLEIAPSVDTCRLLYQLFDARGDQDSALLYAQKCVSLEGAEPKDLTHLVDIGYRRWSDSAVVPQVQLDEYLALAEHSVRLAPSDPATLGAAARWFVLNRQARCALPLLETAVEIAPTDRSLRTLFGVTLCTAGEVREGWRQRLWLERAANPVANGIPRFEGTVRSGMRLLLTCEQGIGDQILYSRMLPDLVRQGAVVTFVCDERLVALMQRSLPGVRVASSVDDLQEFDAFAALGELHLWADPHAPARLVANVERADVYREQINGRRAVGLSWRSHSGANGGAKSVALAELAPVLNSPDCVFVNLQYGEGGDELAEYCRDHGIDFIQPDLDLTHDLDGVASLLSALDDVVCVSNATAHQAAALGVRTHVLVGGRAIWHWQEHGNRSDWYPSARLYRQAHLQGWAEPIAEVARALTS